MAVQPKFQRGKTYEARRGRKKWEVLGIFSDGLGKHTYTVKETPANEERKFPEEQFLELARLKKKGDQVYLSASQVSTFRRCKRKWAFTYINGEVSPPSEAMSYGSEVHAVLEKFLLTGNWQGAADAVACAQQGEHILPAPRDKTLGVEQRFDIPIMNGKARFMGFIDLVVPPRAGNTLEVTDHKTTKDMRYAETSDDLKVNVQANLYSKWAMDKYLKDKVLARWRYYCSRPSRAKAAVRGRPRNMGGFRAVTRVKTKAEVEAQWKELLADAEEMVTLSLNKKVWAKDVEGNEFACNDYGGCPFKGQCEISQSSLGALMQVSKTAHTKKGKEGKEEMGSLMDIINKNKNKKEAAPATQQETPKEAPAKKKSALALAAEKSLEARQKEDGAKGVNPPPVEQTELDPALAKAAEKPTPQTWIDRLKKGHKPRTDDEKVWRKEQEKVLDETTKAAVEKPVETEKPDKAAFDAEGEVPFPTDKDGSCQATKEHKEQKAEDVMRQFDDGLFILMVDCFPAKGASKLFGMTTLAEVLRPFKDAVQKMKDVPHWNLVKYREGETLLAACTEQQFRTNGKPLGIVLADSFSGEWKACGDVLTELADVVVRGGK